MGLVEDIKYRIEYGSPCMKKLSEMSVKEIAKGIEKVWEQSHCSDIYIAIPNGDILKEEYKNRIISVTYNSNLEIKKVTMSWSYWDGIKIELSSLGLIANYVPEHGPSKKLLDLTWGLLEFIFFKKKMYELD